MPEETAMTPDAAPKTPAGDGQASTPQAQDAGSETKAAEAKTFSEDYVRELRDEAAKWRKQVREAESRLSTLEQAEAKKQEAALKEQQHFAQLAEKLEQERDALKAQIEKQGLDLLRSRIATEYALPAALAERLRGGNEDELRADAESLKGLIPAPAAPAAQTQAHPKTTQAQTTTPIPTGTTGETDAQRRARLFGGPVLSS